MADLSDKSRVPLPWVFTLAATLVGCTAGVVVIFLNSEHQKALAMAEFKAEMRTVVSTAYTEVKADLQGIRFDLQASNADRWRKADAAWFAEQLRKLNPGMVVPEVPR